mmetsp:Transcript_69014/g.138794  ORF Transcript_69014/g.138794 Transcript_69014/m.138794 type:complete len:207 (-) Transcript_69014:2431-3051(-)
MVKMSLWFPFSPMQPPPPLLLMPRLVGASASLSLSFLSSLACLNAAVFAAATNCLADLTFRMCSLRARTRFTSFRASECADRHSTKRKEIRSTRPALKLGNSAISEEVSSACHDGSSSLPPPSLPPPSSASSSDEDPASSGFSAHTCASSSVAFSSSVSSGTKPAARRAMVLASSSSNSSSSVPTLSGSWSMVDTSERSAASLSNS